MFPFNKSHEYQLDFRADRSTNELQEPPFNPHFLVKLLKHPLRFKKFESKCLKSLPNERFSLAYEFLQSEGLLPKQTNIQSLSTKCTVEALEYKNRGNEAFFRKQDIEALKLYTRSAAVALPGSAELAIAYGNRSAALYRLKRFKACVVDINRALNEDYPNALKPKLLDRKEKCQSELRNRDTLEVPTRCGDNDSWDPDQNHAMNESSFDFTATDLIYREKFRPPANNFKNGTLSEKLKIEFGENFGYHYVAAEDIQPGELLGVEKPYASLSFSEYQYSHCSNCFVRCEALIPCVTCSSVMYCSESCRQNTFNQYHRIECKILSNAKYFQVGESGLLAFRMLMIATKQGEELEKLMKDPVFNRLTRTFESTNNSLHHLQDYLNLHGVEEDLKKKEFNFLLFSYIAAAIFVHYLKNSEFFLKLNETNLVQNTWTKLTDKELYVGHLLAKFYLTTFCNRFAIVEVIAGNLSDFTEVSPNLGAVIYLHHNLFNHSCDPNVCRNYHKNVVVSSSIQMIRAGQQVCMTYGPTCRSRTRTERQQYLRRGYYFTCDCDACKFNWPFPEECPSWMHLAPDECFRRMSHFIKDMPELVDLLTKRPNLYNPKYLDFIREWSLLVPINRNKPYKEYFEAKEQFLNIFEVRGNFYESTMDQVLLSL